MKYKQETNIFCSCMRELHYKYFHEEITDAETEIFFY